jgi:hypothetical protein
VRRPVKAELEEFIEKKIAKEVSEPLKTELISIF